MKQLIRLTILFCACAALALTVVAGPEPLPSGKEMKQVAPAPPPECNWTGFYIGLNVGGNFGHAENTDLDDFNFDNRPWGYSSSGVVAGGQVGYNYQWNWVVLGIEGEGGYMNIEGSGAEPGVPAHDMVGHSDSDFLTTIRGRLGVAFGHWLFYGTGGGIGLNWETRVIDDCFTGNCGIGTMNAHKDEFDWGWTGGGGIEYMLGCHWTIRGEYLYYKLDDRTFSGPDFLDGTDFIGNFRWNARAEGNIIRGGLNYKF